MPAKNVRATNLKKSEFFHQWFEILQLFFFMQWVGIFEQLLSFINNVLQEIDWKECQIFVGYNGTSICLLRHPRADMLTLEAFESFWLKTPDLKNLAHSYSISNLDGAFLSSKESWML